MNFEQKEMIHLEECEKLKSIIDDLIDRHNMLCVIERVFYNIVNKNETTVKLFKDAENKVELQGTYSFKEFLNNLVNANLILYENTKQNKPFELNLENGDCKFGSLKIENGETYINLYEVTKFIEENNNLKKENENLKNKLKSIQKAINSDESEIN